MSRDDRIGETDSQASPPRSLPAGPEEIQQLRRRMTGLAVKLLWNRDDADEVVQEAFMIALQRNQALGELPWMLRTVANLCLNLRRRRKPEPLGDWIDLPQPASQHDRLEQIESLELLRREMESLPPQQRIALVLRTLEGMEYADIAGVLELTPEAVRTHVHLARRKLIGRAAKGEKQ